MDHHTVPIVDYRFVQATASNISGIEKWFADQQQLSSWAGPGILYPLEKANVVETIGLDKYPSFVLLNDNNDLLGVGQFYQRLNRQHLCRIAINPSARGLGLGTLLVKKLVKQARLVQADCELSLFVTKTIRLHSDAISHWAFRSNHIHNKRQSGLNIVTIWSELESFNLNEINHY